MPTAGVEPATSRSSVLRSASWAKWATIIYLSLIFIFQWILIKIIIINKNKFFLIILYFYKYIKDKMIIK